MQPPAPDPIATCAALGWADVVRAEPLEGGADAALFRVQRASGAVAVLRVFRARQRGMARREVQVMPHVAAHGIPVPQVLAHGIVDERPALLLAWADGERSETTLLPHGLPGIAALGRAAGHLLATLHTLPLPPEWSPQIDWRGSLRLAADEESALLPALEALQTPRPALLHLDLHPLNLFVALASDAPADPLAWGDAHLRISSVIDWGNAAVGDPRAELARVLTIAWLDAAAFPRDVQLAMQTFARHLLAGYCTAMPDIDLRPLPLLLAWAGAAEQRDLAERLAQQPAQLRRVQRWVRWWSWRAGVPLVAVDGERP